MSANRTLLRVILLACVAAVLVAGGLGVHRYRKRSAVDAAHAKGLQAYEARQYTTAAVELGRYVNVHRDDSDALLKYADAQLQRRPQGKGSLEQAVGALEGILRRQPGHAEAAERLSSIYVAVNSPIEVERVARAWSQADPNSAPAKRQLAIALALQKKPGEARKLIDQVVAERPADPKAPEVLMRLVLSQENAASTSAPASASQPADGAPTDPRVAECEKLLQDLATRNPEAAGIRLALAKFHRRYADRGRTVEQQHALALEHLGRAEELAGQDYEMLTEIGQLWREIGDFGRAAKTFARAEQLTPGRIEAYLIQAQLDLEADNYAGGATVADRALKAPVGERRADMLPLAVQFYSRTGRLSDARKYREERAKAGGESDELVYLDGVIQQGDGQLSKALQSFQDAAKRNPKQPRFQLALARAFAANGETERALNPFQEYARMAREAGVGTTPGDLELTSLYLRVGRWGDAVRSARSAVQGSVGTWLFTRAVLADMEVEASIARPNGPNPNPEVLANMAQRVSKLMADPEAAQHFTLQMLSARVAAWNGQVDQAIAALKAVAVEGDQRVAVLQEMVDLLADARRTDEAIQVCTEAAGAVDPRHRAAFEQRLAELRLAKGSAEDAMAGLEAAIKAAPQDSAIQLRLRQAELLVDRGRIKEAADLLSMVARQDPRSTRARLLLLSLPATAEVSIDRQKLISELRDIEGEVGLNWRYMQAVEWMRADGWRTHQAQAEALLKECLSGNPGWYEPAVALARVYERAGDPGQAVQTLQEQIAHTPDQDRAVRLRLQLIEIASRAERWAELDTAVAGLPTKASDPALQQMIEDQRLSQAIRQGRGDQARAMLEERLKDPKDYRARLQLAGVLQGPAMAGDQAAGLRVDELVDEVGRLAPDNADLLPTRISLLLVRSRYDEAINLCSKAVASRPEALALRGRAKEAKGDLPGAEQDLRQFAAADGMAERGWLALGRYYFRHNRTQDALAAWREGLKLAPKSVELRGALIEALLNSNEDQPRQEAVRLIEQRLAESPQDADFQFLQAEYLTKSNPEEAIRICEEVAAKSPGFAKAFIKLTQLSAIKGDAKKAAEWVDKGLAGSPRSVPLLLMKAGLQMGENPAQAAAFARQAANLEPDNERAVLALSEALLRLESPREAVAVLSRFLERPGTQEAHAARLALARLHIGAGESEKAEALVARVESVLPGNAEAMAVRLQGFAARKEWALLADAARAHLDKHAEDLMVAEVAGNQLLEAAEPQDQAKALTFFEYNVSRRPEMAAARAVLGMACLRLGRFDKAREHLEQACRMEPGNLSALNNLAWIVCEDIKDPAGAEKLVAPAIRGGADIPFLWDTWGVVLFRLGRMEDARQAFDRALAHPQVSPETRDSATFHLARAWAEDDPKRSLGLLERLLSTNAQALRLSGTEQTEAAQLRQRLAASRPGG